MLYSLKDEKLIWSGITETKNPKNPAVVVGEIGEQTTKYLQKEGLTQKRKSELDSSRSIVLPLGTRTHARMRRHWKVILQFQVALQIVSYERLEFNLLTKFHRGPNRIGPPVKSDR